MSRTRGTGRGPVPSADVLAAVAKACGGRLAIRGLGDGIEVDPIERDGQKGSGRLSD